MSHDTKRADAVLKIFAGVFMKNKKLLLLFSVVLSLFLITSCTPGTYTNITTENPKKAVIGFVNCLKSRDFDGAEAFVSNYSTMGFDGFENVDPESVDSIIYGMIFDSYRVDFVDIDLSDISIPFKTYDMTVDGKHAQITFNFTSLDTDLMVAKLTEAITIEGAERNYYGETIDTPEKALALVDEVFITTFAEDLSPYYVQKTITLNAVYTRDGWKLEINDDFYSALLG